MPSLGETFKERRRQLGLTLAQAETETRIRARSLEALEDGNYAALPAPGYVRGYVTSYAKFLELDPIQMLGMYRAETGNARQHRIVPPDEAVKPRSELHAIPWQTAAVVVGIVAVLVLVVWGVSTLTHRSSSVQPIPPQSGTTQTSGASGAGSPQVNSISAPPFTVRVAVSPNGASSLKVTIDGKPAYSGTLAGGQSKQFQASKTAKIVVGTPSVVAVTKDGTPVKIVASGGTGTVTLTAGAQ